MRNMTGTQRWETERWSTGQPHPLASYFLPQATWPWGSPTENSRRVHLCGIKGAREASVFTLIKPCAVHIALFVRRHWIPTLTVRSVTHAGKFSFLTWSQGPYSHQLQHMFMLMNTLADSLSNLSLIWVTLQHKPTLKWNAVAAQWKGKHWNLKDRR